MVAEPLASVVGNAPAIEHLRQQIRHLATFDRPGAPNAPTVLLQGETGTGKGLVARALHASGGRAQAGFVDVNCAAIPESMLEAELFGFEAGAFTDAKRAKPGLFEVASGGTLFLDEIDALPLSLQSKLLKVIDEKTLRRLGAIASQRIDVKLIAATQRDLPALVAAGTFRADLYHRLAVVLLDVPPLRTRGDDVIVLAEHFLADHAAGHRIAPKRLVASAHAWLATHSWPGNVRELSHLMERVTLLRAEREIDGAILAHLCVPLGPVPAAAVSAPPATAPSVETDEPARIRDALARSGGNVVRAARVLGIGRNALRHRMRRYGITRPALDEPPPAPPAAAARPRPAAAAPAKEASEPSWERRPVAVLAIDVVLPDGVYEPWTVARELEQTIADRIAGFGGVFVARSPSRLTALFGVPRALEQLPQRAVQAALSIRRQYADDPTIAELRMAAHLGTVRLDATTPEDTARVVPIGDTLALPERLLGHAGAGEILVSAPVGRRVESSCELAARELRVGDQAIAAYTVRGARPHTGTVDVAPATAFVGRERELAQLVECFESVRPGTGLVAFTVGEAGIGKSRLLAELHRQLEGRPHRWIEGRCAAYGTSAAFLPILDGLRRFFEIDDRDDGASLHAKLERGVSALGDLLWTLPYLRQLFGLAAGDASAAALDSASRRSETFRALKELVREVSAQAPLVILVEDLHWIDPASEEFLTFLADAVPTMPVLLICSHRPGYRHPFGDHSYHVRIALRALSGQEMAAVSRSLLGTSEIPAEVQALIANKAEGNPFFVEEMTRSLLEDGTLRRANGGVVLTRAVTDVVVPETVQDVLIARLDRLADDARRAIQVASVIGREFALRLLARITEAGVHLQTHVDELRALELIYEKATHPELAYMFKHALTHDVAYESVVAERRRELHRTIGLAIEELYADRLAEFYETLAHHFSRAGDWERAFAYHTRAAEKAAETFANRSVVGHCREALAIADRLGTRVSDERRRGLEERMALSLFYVSEFGASAEAFVRAAERSHAVEQRVANLSAAAQSQFWDHSYDTMTRTTEALHAIARAEGLPIADALALSAEGFYRGVCHGDVATEQQLLREALRIGAGTLDEAARATIQFYVAQNAEWTGDYRGAIAESKEVIAAGRRLRLPHLIIWPAWFQGKAACCLGDYGEAIALLTEAYEICDRIGDRVWKSRLLNTLGWAYAEIGDHARALGFNERAAVLAREIGDPEIIANSEINLTGNHLALGDRARAEACLAPIRDALTRPADPFMRWRYTLHAFDAMGRLAVAGGAPDRALAHADDELRGAERHRVPKVQARALLLRGASLIALERSDEADAALTEAARIAETIAYPNGVWRALGMRASLARRIGRAADAERHLAAQRVLVGAALRSLADAGLRRTLESTALPVSS
ncbi:MAG TPA: sigma 54-interacting transcriptional regulator [Candidatus Binatia bacterium]|jgi:DNA-binding NtrC family response regulator/tetratricopeptide (TPR) repeat protein